MYFNLVKFSKNLQNFLKWRLQRRFGRFAPENPKTLQSTPPSGRNPAIETPLGGRDPIISSAFHKFGIFSQKIKCQKSIYGSLDMIRIRCILAMLDSLERDGVTWI